MTTALDQDRFATLSPRTAAPIKAALDAPKTHVVVTTFADGRQRRHETRNAASAKTHADFVERPKIGRDLIDRETGGIVRVVSVEIAQIAAAL